MKNENQEIVRPEIPLELEAVGALAKLAGGILSSGDLLELTTMPVRSHATAPNTIAQARYQILIDQLPAATFMAWFENGRCELYVSSHIETLLGYTATEWIENPILWYERLHPDDRERWNEEFSRTITCAAPFKGDYRFLAKDGRLVWIHGEAKVLRDESADGEHLMGGKLLAEGGPRSVYAGVQERSLNANQQMISQHAKEDVGLNPALQVMKNGPFHQWAFHAAESRLDSRQQDVGAPHFFMAQIKPTAF